MKTLYVIRHAKSSWNNPDESDFERPLNERGKRDAPRMGKRLKERDIHPDLMLTSPARRARSTCRRIAKILAYPKEAIKENRNLYHASDEAILAVVHGLKDKHDSVMLVGHNPGLTDFVNSLMAEEQDIDNIPTCGVVAFKLPVKQWSQVNWGTGKIVFFDYPKSKED